jgi:hypothetical protein
MIIKTWYKTQLTDIPQIAVGFTLILLPFLSPDKAKPVRLEADPSDFEPPPRPVLKDAGLAFIEMHLCREWEGVSASILEGLDEMVTLTQLGLPPELRRSLTCTNIIENVMGKVRRVNRNVKYWRSPSMALRWAGTAIPPVPSPTSAHSSLNLHISVSLAFCPQDGRVQFAAEDENGSDHVEKDECDHHRRETRVGGNVIARELGEVGAEGNARRDP